MINQVTHSSYTQPSSINNSAKKSDATSFEAFLSTEKGKNITSAAKTKGTTTINSTVMKTAKGALSIDLNSYFSNEPNSVGVFSIGELPPLLLPSGENIQALSEHISGRFAQMLSGYNIPEAPNKITYDTQGQIHFPLNYAHAEKLKQALEGNPGISSELSTINALSSHYVEIQKRVPFTEEMSSANSQMAKDRIIAKYSHLLHDNHGYSSLALHFNKEGQLSVSANNSSVVFT